MKVHRIHTLRHPLRRVLDRAGFLSFHPTTSWSQCSPDQSLPISLSHSIEKVQNEVNEENLGCLEDDWDFSSCDEAPINESIEREFS